MLLQLLLFHFVVAVFYESVAVAVAFAAVVVVAAFIAVACWQYV